MNPKNGMCILEFRSLYEYIISLLFHEKTVSYLCGGLINKIQTAKSPYMSDQVLLSVTEWQCMCFT